MCAALSMKVELSQRTCSTTDTLATATLSGDCGPHMQASMTSGHVASNAAELQSGCRRTAVAPVASLPLGMIGHLTANDQFTRLYATFGVWKFRRTLSYWIVVVFIEGALTFTFSAVAGMVPDVFGRNLPAMTAWPMLLGHIAFTLGCYLMCLHVINLKGDDDDPLYLNAFAYARATAQLELAGHDSTHPYLAAVAYFAGTLVYWPPCLIALCGNFHDLSYFWQMFHFVFDTLSCVLGGSLFVLGGYFEVLENRVFPSNWPWTMGGWMAMGNFVGALFFLLGALLAEVDGFWSNFAQGVGAFIYFVASVNGMFMWREEQFGLQFLGMLNNLSCRGTVTFSDELADDHSQASNPARFSLRGLCFVVLYCCTSVLGLFNSCLVLAEYLDEPTADRLATVYGEAFPIVLFHLVLAMHSAVVRVPKTQPYHSLIIALRWLALVTCVFLFIRFQSRVVCGMHPPHLAAAVDASPPPAAAAPAAPGAAVA